MAHIAGGHEEMEAYVEDIRRTIENPAQVNRDVDYAQRECHYGPIDAGRRRLKVVVHYRPIPPQGTWVGEVITAYPAREVDPKEEPLWVEPLPKR